MNDKLFDNIKTFIEFGYNPEKICSIIGISDAELLGCLQKIQMDEKRKNRYILIHNLMHSNPYNIFENSSKICIISDTHYFSIKDRPDIIKLIYSYCDDEGIKHVFCAGDFTNGYYPKHLQYNNDNKVDGIDNMIDYVVNKHPFRKNIMFYTISGNHDLSFLRTRGINICREIVKYREDMVYLGHNKISVKFNNLLLCLSHGNERYGRGEKRYQRYYKDYLTASEKPDIIALGHIHRSGYRKYNDTHILQTPALVDTPKYLLSKGICSQKGFWTADISTVDENVIISPKLYEIDDGLGISRVKIKGGYYDGK